MGAYQIKNEIYKALEEETLTEYLGQPHVNSISFSFSFNFFKRLLTFC